MCCPMWLQAVAVPFVAGALYFNPPIAFVSLIPAYVVGKCIADLGYYQCLNCRVVEPPQFLALPPNSCPHVTSGESIPTSSKALAVYPAEDSNDKECGPCSKNDQ